MEQFLKIRENIVRCTYTAEPEIHNASLFLEPEAYTGTPVSACPLDVVCTELTPRQVVHLVPDGKPILRETVTVDGKRFSISNLKEMPDRMAWKAVLELRFAENEHIYGLGQDEDGVLDHRHHLEYLYQHNMKIAIPMFVSSRGYGVLFNCGCLMIFDDTGETCRITLECVDQLDFFVITGTMDEIVAGYRFLTGRAAELPDWALGYWQSKEKYSSQEELLEVARRYRKEQVPLDVIVQDWKTWEGDNWGDKHLDKQRYPDIRACTDELHRMGVHALVSVWPNMNPGGRDHREFAEQNLLLADYSTYDAYNPEARALYWKQLERELYAGGFDGWWCDSTEPFPAPDWCGCEKRPEKLRYALVGGEHEKYLDPACANAYGLMHARGIWEHQPQKPVVNLTRSGWAGCQKYGTILWAGDTSATWEELKREIAKGINLSLSGIPYWTVDAGAFFTGSTACWRKWSGNPDAEPVWFWHGDYDRGVEDPAYEELYTRWLQFSCFLPIFRSHGTDTPREFWNFREPYRSAIVKTIRLRYQLMDYIREQFRKVHEEHFTILRSLLFDFPDDPRAPEIDDAYLFGRDLLVCPVLKPMKETTVRHCYLPQGARWRLLQEDRIYEGGQTAEIPVTLDQIPVFARVGGSMDHGRE